MARGHSRWSALMVSLLATCLLVGCDSDDGGRDSGSPQPGPGFDGGIPDAGLPPDGGIPPDAGIVPDGGTPEDGGVPDGGMETGATLSRLPFEHFVHEVEVDASGNTFVLLRYEGRPSFQDTPLPNDDSGKTQNAVVKLGPTLAVIWTRALPSGGPLAMPTEEGVEVLQFHLAAWPDGAVALAGSFEGTLRTPVGVLQSSNDRQSGFVARLSPEGEWEWARLLDATRLLAVSDVAANGSFVALAGSFAGTSAALGGREAPGEQHLAGFALRLDTSGSTQAVHVFAGDVDSLGSGVALLADGRSAVTGTLRNRASDGVSGVVLPYVAQLAADGSIAWEKHYPSFPGGSLGRVTLDAAGATAAAGSLRAETPVSWGESLLQTGSGGADVVLAWEPDGQERWGRVLAQNVVGLDVEADARGLLTMTAKGQGLLDFGGGDSGQEGEDSLFVVRLRMDSGTHVWTEALRLERDERPFSQASPFDVALLADGRGRVAAYADGLVEFIPR